MWEIAIGPRSGTRDKSDLTPDLLLSDLIYVAAPGHDSIGRRSIDRPGVKVELSISQSVRQALKPDSRLRGASAYPGGRTAIDGIEMPPSGKVDVFGADSESSMRSPTVSLARRS